MSNDAPRPNLNFDKNYLKKVQDLIVNNKEKENIHFEYLQELVDIFISDCDIYNLQKGEESGAQVELIVQKIFEKVSSEAVSEKTKQTLYKLWNYLSEGDDLKKADLIFVFGGISVLAVEEAIELKNKGYAPKIMFSGKKASYQNDTEMTEAEKYRDMAVLKGVPKEDIILEMEAIITPENIVKSREILRELGVMPNSVIAISLPYHMKRAALTMNAGFDWSFELIRNPGKSAKYTRENYFMDSNGFKYIFFEYLKIFEARRMGHF